ncbi:MAG: type pilus assembly protein PilA [Actinomycetota bacterium]|jgi:type IV pilus assembly protein PilA|nr:type pilus assembly protein PilA [Actinomycetota bacterium]
MMIKIRKFSAERRAAMQDVSGQQGFTLIELMVVIIIIGLLAAIAIPQFLGQRKSAWDAETKSDLGNFELAASSYSLKNGGDFGTAAAPMTLSALGAAPYRFAPSVDDPIGNWTLVVSADVHSYTITVFNQSFVPTTAGHVFTFDSSTGLTSVS